MTMNRKVRIGELSQRGAVKLDEVIMTIPNISNKPPIKKRDSGQDRRQPRRIVSCGLLETLLDQYGDDHPHRVGRVDLIPSPTKNEA